MPHFRLEIGGRWLQIGRTEPEPPQPEPASTDSGVVLDHPTPTFLYHPEHVGFYRLSDEND